MSCKGLSLMSGGLDSQLAVRVLQGAGAEVEGVCFETPFFSSANARKAAAALGVKLHVLDFTEDEVSLVENPPHGFGGAMNPCIDCHATMIRRAGELMTSLGFDFVSTGEVMGQRPMSQNKQSLCTVEKSSGLKGRLVRPMSAKLLEPTIPEIEGKLDREKLLDIHGRSRERQIALAKEFDKPIIVHSRSAAEDTMRVIKECYGAGARKDHGGECRDMNPAAGAGTKKPRGREIQQCDLTEENRISSGRSASRRILSARRREAA